MNKFIIGAIALTGASRNTLIKKVKEFDKEDIPYGLKDLDIPTRYFIPNKKAKAQILKNPDFNRKSSSIFGVKVI